MTTQPNSEMINYHCITFGPAKGNSNIWRNDIYSGFATQRSASRQGLDLLCVAGVFGYVVIEEGVSYWMVVDEVGAPSHVVSIYRTQDGTFKVQPSPQLALV